MWRIRKEVSHQQILDALRSCEDADKLLEYTLCLTEHRLMPQDNLLKVWHRITQLLFPNGGLTVTSVQGEPTEYDHDQIRKMSYLHWRKALLGLSRRLRDEDARNKELGR